MSDNSDNVKNDDVRGLLVRGKKYSESMKINMEGNVKIVLF